MMALHGENRCNEWQTTTSTRTNMAIKRKRPATIAACRLRSRHLFGSSIGATLALVLMLSSIVCLSNYFQNKAVQAATTTTTTTIVGTQKTANFDGTIRHSVPRARLSQMAAPTATITTTSGSRLELPPNQTTGTIDATRQIAGLCPCSSVGAKIASGGRNLDNLKYVNYTSEQISSETGSINHPTSAIELELVPKHSQDTSTGPPLASQLNGSVRQRRASRRSVGQQQQFGTLNNLVGPPKLIQWSKEAVHYYEGSTLVLSCSLSYSGGESGQLKFSWFKQGKLLASSSTIGGRGIDQPSRLSIETLADYSFLRLADLRPGDSGAYSCVVSNSLNQEDRTTTQVVVNVKLKWLMPITSGSQESNQTILIGNGHQFERVRAGQSVSFECNAAGGGGGHSKGLRVRWFRLVGAHNGSGGSQQVAATMSTSNHGKDHYYKASSQSAFVRNQRTMDEAQIKANLLQMDTGLTLADSFNRIELINSNGVDSMEFQKDKQQQVGLLNDTASNNQLRWRIETNSGSSSSFQQHEIYSRLVLERLEPGSSGLYECEVISLGSLDSQSAESTSSSSGLNQRTSSAPGEKLKKFFGLFVNGKY